MFICRGGDHASIDEISSVGMHVPPKMKTETARSVRRDIGSFGSFFVIINKVIL